MMAATTSLGRGRFCLWAALFLATSGLIMGCNPQALNFLLMPFVDDKEPPECKLTSSDKKEVTVAIVTSFANLEMRPEILSFDAELSDRLAVQMRKLATVTKEKIKFVPSSKVRNLMNQEVGSSLSRQEIGQKLKADYVINLEIHAVSLYEKGSSNTLLSGKTEIDVTCTDITKPRNEGTIFQKIYSRGYPGARGPIAVGDTSLVEFRTQFLNVVSQEIAYYFVAYPSDVVRKMD